MGLRVWPHHWPGIALLVDILPHVESDEDLLHITGHGGVIEVQRHPDTELWVCCKLSFLLCLCSRLQGWTGIKLVRYPGPAQNMYTQCSSGGVVHTHPGPESESGWPEATEPETQSLTHTRHPRPEQQTPTQQGMCHFLRGEKNGAVLWKYTKTQNIDKYEHCPPCHCCLLLFR